MSACPHVPLTYEKEKGKKNQKWKRLATLTMSKMKSRSEQRILLTKKELCIVQFVSYNRNQYVDDLGRQIESQNLKTGRDRQGSWTKRLQSLSYCTLRKMIIFSCNFNKIFQPSTVNRNISLWCTSLWIMHLATLNSCIYHPCTSIL